MKIYLPILLILFISLFTACDSDTANSNENTNSKPSPSPTPTKEEREQKEKAVEAEKEKAVDEFILKSYKGWQLKGVGGGIESCDEDSTEPCNLLLNNGKENKVVAVMVKRFTNQNGQSYLYVFEARSIDLSKAKLEKIKEQEKDETLASLTTDDVSTDLKQEIVQAADEERAEMERESADPPDNY